MKKFILILFLFVSFSAIGQTNRFPSIDSLKTYILKYVRNSTVESFTNLRLQNVVYGTAELLDSLTANMSGGVDSIWKSAGGGSDTLKYSKGGTTYTIGVLSNGAYVPYTGATADVDLGNFNLNAKGISVTGTAGNGHLHLKHQSSAPSSTASSTTVYADANGNLAYKNDGLNRVTFNGLNITADRTFSFQNKSYTLADSADVAGKQGALTLTTTGSSGAATLVGNTLNIPQYSGGGGSADSSWVSSETGVAPNQLGFLVNSTLGSLPSGWADNTPTATVTFSGKMIVSGGTTGTTALSANTGVSTVYLNRIDMDYYPYSKMRYAFRVVPQDKTSSSAGLALHFQANSLFFSGGTRFVFDLSSTADSGKISVSSNFGSAFAQSGNLSHAAGDTLDIEVVRDHWYVYTSMLNRRTGKRVDVSYSGFGAPFGTGGKAYLGILGGSQHILSAKVESYDLKNGNAITVIGDSQFAGSGATSEEKTAVMQIFRGNKLKVANLSNGALTLSAAVASHVPAAIALNNPVIITLGYNDRRDLSADTATFKTRLAAVVDPLVAAGIPIHGIATMIQAAGASVNFNIAVRNYCAANGYTVINIDSAVASASNIGAIKENYLSSDAVHWSDSGQYVGAQKVIATLGEKISSLFTDTVSAVTMYNLPTGEANMNRLVVDNKGKVKQVPATTFDAIFNARNYNGVGTIAQTAEAHISGVYKSDSAVFVHNRKGLLIGFNGGSANGAGNAGTNIEITNDGIGGTGFPQRFLTTETSSNNVLIRPVTKGGYTPNFTGSNDIYLGLNAGIQTTSGSNNFEARTGGVSTITTGNNIIAITPNNGYSTTSNQIILGWASAGWGNFGNRIHIGYGDYGGAGSNETVLAPVLNGNATTYFTQKVMFSGSAIMKIAANGNGGNQNGYEWNFESGSGVGTGNSGSINFKTTSPSAHGSYVTRLSLQNHNVILGSARFQTKTGANVASANDLTLGNDGNVFTITGTTQINAITTTNWQAGSEVVLIFSGSVTVKNNTAGGGGTAVMLLAGGVDFSATSNDVLKLVYNGTSWFEVSRSVN